MPLFRSSPFGTRALTGFFVLTLLAAAPGHAAPRIHLAASYNLGLTISSQEGTLDSFVPLGFGADLGLKLAQHWSVGLAFGWQYGSSETSEALTIEGVTISGSQKRSAYAVPFLVGGHYLFDARPRLLRPSFGLYLGGYYFHRSIEGETRSVHQGKVLFGIAPEIGLGVNLGHFEPQLVVRYNHAFSASGDGPLIYLTFNIGCAWGA